MRTITIDTPCTGKGHIVPLHTGRTLHGYPAIPKEPWPIHIRGTNKTASCQNCLDSRQDLGTSHAG
jgi:hypothetical protein